MNDSRLAQQKIIFIGAGSMAEALLRGLIDADLVPPSSIAVLNRNSFGRLHTLKETYGVMIPETNEPEERNQMVQDASIVVLAMKPKDVGEAINEFRSVLRPEQLIVSVIAGLTIPTIEHLLNRPQPIVRTMPNTSSTIGLGATGLACSETVTPAHKNMAQTMFDAVGLAIALDEHKLNIVTGLSGSGPAYVYFMLEAMIEAGVQGGLSAAEARELALQTVLGAAEMVKSTGEDPALLRAKVTSPNGTTFAAIGVLEQYSFREGMIKAIARASDRAREMGEEIAASLIENNNEGGESP